jgi:hypothetical protein
MAGSPTAAILNDRLVGFGQFQSPEQDRNCPSKSPDRRNFSSMPTVRRELPPLTSYALRATVAEWGLPNSLGAALDPVDLRLPTFGLTLPPLAVALVPNANILSPSSRMLIAAFTSRSWFLPQLLHCQRVSSLDITRKYHK